MQDQNEGGEKTLSQAEKMGLPQLWQSQIPDSKEIQEEQLGLIKISMNKNYVKDRK
jgi:hypothetical protein